MKAVHEVLFVNFLISLSVRIGNGREECSNAVQSPLGEMKPYYLQKLMGKQVNINLKIAFQEQSWCMLNFSIKETSKSGSSIYSKNTSIEC